MASLCPEKRLIPALTLFSITLEIVTLCARNWLEGYYGDVVVLMMSPWRHCRLECLSCANQRPTVECFWVSDWAETGFETLSISAHVEYWCVGLLCLGLLLSLLDCAHGLLPRRRCAPDLARPTLIVLLVACFLSTISVSLVGARLHHDTAAVTKYSHIPLSFGWPLYLRMCSGVAAWCACVAAICNQCRSQTRTFEANDERIMVITSGRDCVDDSLDEAENGALL